MYLYELNYPGTWLQLENEERRSEIENMLRGLEGILTEAAISLSMFEESQNQRGDPREEWERDAELRQQIDDEIREEVGYDYYLKLMNTGFCLKNDLEIERQNWVFCHDLSSTKSHLSMLIHLSML